jgi:hypothetical protein
VEASVTRQRNSPTVTDSATADGGQAPRRMLCARAEAGCAGFAGLHGAQLCHRLCAQSMRMQARTMWCPTMICHALLLIVQSCASPRTTRRTTPQCCRVCLCVLTLARQHCRSMPHRRACMSRRGCVLAMHHHAAVHHTHCAWHINPVCLTLASRCQHASKHQQPGPCCCCCLLLLPAATPPPRPKREAPHLRTSSPPACQAKRARMRALSSLRKQQRAHNLIHYSWTLRVELDMHGTHKQSMCVLSCRANQLLRPSTTPTTTSAPRPRYAHRRGDAAGQRRLLYKQEGLLGPQQQRRCSFACAAHAHEQTTAAARPAGTAMVQDLCHREQDLCVWEYPRPHRCYTLLNTTMRGMSSLLALGASCVECVVRRQHLAHTFVRVSQCQHPPAHTPNSTQSTTHIQQHTHTLNTQKPASSITHEDRVARGQRAIEAAIPTRRADACKGNSTPPSCFLPFATMWHNVAAARHTHTAPMQGRHRINSSHASTPQHTCAIAHAGLGTHTHHDTAGAVAMVRDDGVLACFRDPTTTGLWCRRCPHAGAEEGVGWGGRNTHHTYARGAPCIWHGRASRVQPTHHSHARACRDGTHTHNKHERRTCSTPWPHTACEQGALQLSAARQGAHDTLTRACAMRAAKMDVHSRRSRRAHTPAIADTRRLEAHMQVQEIKSAAASDACPRGACATQGMLSQQ